MGDITRCFVCGRVFEADDEYCPECGSLVEDMPNDDARPNHGSNEFFCAARDEAYYERLQLIRKGELTYA